MPISRRQSARFILPCAESVAVRAIFAWGTLLRSDPRRPRPRSESASTHSPPARRPRWLPPSRPAPSIRLGLADLAQRLVPPISQQPGGWPAAAGVMSYWRAWTGGTTCPRHLAVCLGRGEAVRQRVDPGEPERRGAAELEPPGVGSMDPARPAERLLRPGKICCGEDVSQLAKLRLEVRITGSGKQQPSRPLPKRSGIPCALAPPPFRNEAAPLPLDTQVAR